MAMGEPGVKRILHVIPWLLAVLWILHAFATGPVGQQGPDPGRGVIDAPAVRTEDEGRLPPAIGHASATRKGAGPGKTSFPAGGFLQAALAVVAALLVLALCIRMHQLAQRDRH